MVSHAIHKNEEGVVSHIPLRQAGNTPKDLHDIISVPFT